MLIALLNREKVKTLADLAIVFWGCFIFLQIAVAGARGPPFLALSFPPFSKMCAAETACAHICEKGGNEKGRMNLLHRTMVTLFADGHTVSNTPDLF
jgi:hypothetical protein